MEDDVIELIFCSKCETIKEISLSFLQYFRRKMDTNDLESYLKQTEIYRRKTNMRKIKGTTYIYMEEKEALLP